MKNYLVLVRGSGPGFEKLDEDGRNAIYGSWMEYVKKLNEDGSWVLGNPLDESGRLYCDKREPAEGIVGDPDVSIAGYMILKAENYDAVIKICDDCPSLTIGGKLEIRECIEM